MVCNIPQRKLTTLKVPLYEFSRRLKKKRGFTSKGCVYVICLEEESMFEV